MPVAQETHSLAARQQHLPCPWHTPLPATFCTRTRSLHAVSTHLTQGRTPKVLSCCNHRQAEVLEKCTKAPLGQTHSFPSHHPQTMEGPQTPHTHNTVHLHLPHLPHPKDTSSRALHLSTTFVSAACGVLLRTAWVFATALLHFRVVSSVPGISPIQGYSTHPQEGAPEEGGSSRSCRSEWSCSRRGIIL